MARIKKSDELTLRAALTNTEAAYALMVNNSNGEALSQSALFAGVRFAANGVSGIPLDLYLRDDEGSREKDYRHRAYKMTDRPNPFLTRERWLNLAVKDCLMYGNHYSVIVGDDIYPLDPNTVGIVIENGEPIYSWKIDNDDYKASATSIIHFKGLMADSFQGYSVIDVLSGTINYGNYLNRHGERYFENGAKPSYVIILPPDYKSPAKIKEYVDAYKSAHQGVNNVNKTAFMMAGTTIQDVGYSNDSSQFIEAKRFNLIEVANVLGIPPSLIGADQNTSYGSLEADQQSFLDHCINPLLKMIEDELELKLLTEAEKDLKTHYFEFNRKAVISLNASVEADVLIKLVTNRLLSVEEARARLNLSTKGKATDTWINPVNMALSTDPKPEPAPQAPATPIQAEPQGDPAELRAMELVALERLCKRLEKSNKSPLTHLPIFQENLPRLKEWSEEMLRSIDEEWKQVLPEQRIYITDRVLKDYHERFAN